MVGDVGNQPTFLGDLVQFSCSVMSNSLWPQGLQPTRLPCPSTTPRAYSNHVHWVGHAIQPSHPLSSPSPPTIKSIRVFSTESVLHSRRPKYWSFRTDSLLDGLVGSPCCPRDSQESSPTTQLKSINSLALSFLYSPTLTSIHEYWKNHSFV